MTAQTPGLIHPRVRGTVLAGLVALLLCTLALPASAASEDEALVRLTHLSPDTKEVDVYLTDLDGAESLVLPSVGYGMASDYIELPEGAYTFAMRPAEAPATEETVVLRLPVDLEAGAAYTVAVIGPNEDLRETVLTDDLERPGDGAASVRVIQAAQTDGPVDVVASAGGPVVASEVAFATATDYVEVPAGPWRLTVRDQGADLLTGVSVPLEAGSVSTLVLLETDDGPRLRLLSDAAAPATEPRGSVETGSVATPGDSAARLASSALLLAAAAALALAAAHGGVESERAPKAARPRPGDRA